jgi:type I restriction enzyme, S subunit
VRLKFVEIGELMARRNGSVNPANFPEEVFELHSIPAFDAGAPDIVPGRQIGSSKQIVQPNDVLISKIVPHIRRASIVGQSSGLRQIASGEWIIFRDEHLHPNYLRQLLVSDFFHTKFMSTVSGVGGSLLRARPAEVAKIKIPLPPLSEQRRIAAVLDKTDALRTKRRESIGKLDQLLQSVFLEMFGDPMTNPKRWPVHSLGQLLSSAEVFTDGDWVESKDQDANGAVRLIQLADVGDAVYVDKSRRFLTKETAQRLRCTFLQTGDILVARMPDPLGRACIFPEMIASP